MSFLLLRGSLLVSPLYQSIPYGVVVCTHGGVTSLVLSSHALFTEIYFNGLFANILSHPKTLSHGLLAVGVAHWGIA